MVGHFPVNSLINPTFPCNARYFPVRLEKQTTCSKMPAVHAIPVSHSARAEGCSACYQRYANRTHFSTTHTREDPEKLNCSWTVQLPSSSPVAPTPRAPRHEPDRCHPTVVFQPSKDSPSCPSTPRVVSPTSYYKSPTA